MSSSRVPPVGSNFAFDRTVANIPHGDFARKALAVIGDEIKEIQRRMRRCDAASDVASTYHRTQEGFGFMSGSLLYERRDETSNTEVITDAIYMNIPYNGC